MVALSTDKAVKPVNAMGTSKAMMEKLVTSRNRVPRETIFCCVRYGNVMGSRGSVIPLFRKQIEAGGPVTVTVPQMTRFLMTLDESVELVVHAMTNAAGGEIFVRKAPAAMVADLARAMIAKYGDGREVPVKVVGIRPGEKLDEVLVNEYEMQRAADSADYYTIFPEYRPAPGPASRASVPLGTEYTSANTRQLTSEVELGALLDRVGLVEYYV
jgi:FlaA1/EpsC-like NDP-sugar epimerase